LPKVFATQGKDGDCVDNRPRTGTVKSSDTLGWEASAQENLMTTQANRLPSRFPVGTKFVIESRPAQLGGSTIYSRYLELPDGRSFLLPSRSARKLAGKVRHRPGRK
jgi:hypothetical protein